MNAEKLKKILDDHKLWLDDEGGERADLRNADLRDADLRNADLRDADLCEADLSNADLRNADLSHADLCEADLRNADLSGANLRNASLDFSCWPLWCGSLDVKVGKRIFSQLAYHLCRVNCEDDEAKEAQAALKKIANKFHRVDECGVIE